MKPEDQPRNQLGHRLAPGLWVDREGNPHWSITELMQEFDLADTPESRAQVTAFVEEVMRDYVKATGDHNLTIIHREKPD